MLDDYTRATPQMWRLTDSVFFYLRRTTTKNHGVDAQQMAYLFGIAGLDDEKRVSNCELVSTVCALRLT